MENCALPPRILSAKFKTIRPTEPYVLLYYRHSRVPSITINNPTTQQND